MSFLKGVFLKRNSQRTEATTNIEDYLYVQMKWMMLMGLWPPGMTIKFVPPILVEALRLFYNCFVSFIMLHIAVLYAITLYFDSQQGTFAGITYSLSQTVIYAFSGACIVYFQWRSDICFQLWYFLNENFKFRSAKGLTYVNAEAAYKFSRAFTMIYSFSAWLTVLQPSVFALFTKGRTLPLRMWYPFDQYASPMYEIIFVSHTLAQMALAMGFFNSLTFTLSISMMACEQFDILFCSLKNIRYTAMIMHGGYSKELRSLQSKIDLKKNEYQSKFYSATERLDCLDDFKDDHVISVIPKKGETKQRISYGPSDSYQMELIDELNDALKQCIFHHHMITKCCQMLEDITSPFILVKSLEISFQICVLALTVMKTASTASFTENTSMAQYFILTVFDLFMISYLGQIIQDQSVRVRDFLFATPWYLFGAPFRRSMLIMIQNTIRPQIITGGKFFVLGYDKCTGILKLSFSYFTLLNNLGGK